MSAIGAGVSLRGIPVEAFDFTWNLNSAVVAADVGKPMSVDTAAANTAKIAADGDAVMGSLASYENRVQEGIKVGTISHKTGVKYTYTGTAPTVGGQIQGAGSGNVKTLTGSNARFPHIVVSVNTTDTTVEVLFL